MFHLLRLPAIFDRDLRFLSYSMFFRRIVMGFLQVVRTLYFYSLGLSPIEIGLLMSLATIVSALHSVVFGVLCDKHGRKPFLILGGIFATLRLIIFAISTDIWMLALGQGLGALGEGAGAGQPVVSGYITDKTKTSHQRSQVYSFIAVTNSLAATIGSAVAGAPTYLQSFYMLDEVSAHQIIWWICAIGTATSLLLVLPLTEVNVKKDPKRIEKKDRKIKSWGLILKFSLVRSTSGLGWGLSESLLPLFFLIRFNIGSEVLGPIYAFSRFLSIFSYLLVPRIVDWLGEINTLLWSRLIAGVFTFSFAFTTFYPLAVVMLIIMRVVLMFSMPIRQTFAAGMVDPEETATAIGISSFARMGVRSFAPTLAGYMFEVLSLSLPFIIGSLLIVTNGILYKIYYGEKK